MIRDLAAGVFGFASGIVISGAAYAFITVVGVVPRMAEKTKTSSRIRFYEESVMLGGITGTLLVVMEPRIPIGMAAAMVLSFCSGIFFGVFAMSLAEVLDVIPVLIRRGKVKRGMYYFITAIAIGKFLGSLMYYIIPGFFSD